MLDLSFYKNKKVLITGHTGFKGSWLTKLMLMAGAGVTGYSLEAPTEPSLFDMLFDEGEFRSEIGDIRDYEHLNRVFDEEQPEIVFHLAAQPIVRTSYKEPRYTYETNVMGTVNLLECVRNHASVRSVLNVTTDKVYLNRDDDTAFKEDMPLDGYDPYSNSKSCSELVTHSYVKSFFSEKDSPAISTARAGNVIGGGDFAVDRLIPDCVRAAEAGTPIIIRNPQATRPFQHVLEPLAVYMEIAQKQYEDKEKYADYYNVGPELSDVKSAGELADLFCKAYGDGLVWENHSDGGPHEASFLKLDCTKIKDKIGWHPVWRVGEAVRKTAKWSHVYLSGGDVKAETEKEIKEYLQDMEESVFRV
ncbi:CDP-glucose 4,6-dehydratase [Lachnospiraceae bacterium]|nr:CDP-glucose 4,6-dehydratase [Lachnospiraceae bacterium]